ncbi:MAG: polysaccharide deacetylase family protein [Azospirillaceae bacterium]|nr:polysaccharide deacetylase family protein [Azospirillaceae bacterium]
MTIPAIDDAGRAWDALDVELERRVAAGAVATLWWRDDDAITSSPALTRLRSLGPIPIVLAVIPQPATPDLATALASWPLATVVQHGFAHTDHAPVGAKRVELGGGRSIETLRSELTRGRDRLLALFGDRFRPVLVPPWNRIDPGLIPALPSLGFRGLSTFGPRRLVGADDAAVLSEVNSDIDIMDWRKRCFAGAVPVLNALVGRLGQSRQPIGVLTHHLVHDDAAWRFLERLVARLHPHPAVRWCDAATLFAPPAGGLAR